MLIPVLQIYFMLLVWRSGNGIRHSNEVKLRWARLISGLVTTFGGSTIRVSLNPLSLV